MKMNSFYDFNLDKRLLKKIHDKSITEPTEIQQEIIPKILDGNDVIGQSRTGTGKTLAYLLPLIQLNLGFRAPVLIISPTKELASQIYQELNYLVKDNFQISVRKGFIIYTRSKNKLVEIPLKDKDFIELEKIIDDMTNIIQNCRYPKPTSIKSRCFDCCYKNICESII